MVRLNQSVLLNGNELFKEFKGALTEQYVLQQFMTIKHMDTYYWTNNRGSAEIDFLIEESTLLEKNSLYNKGRRSIKQFRINLEDEQNTRKLTYDKNI